MWVSDSVVVTGKALDHKFRNSSHQLLHNITNLFSTAILKGLDSTNLYRELKGVRWY